MAKRKTIPLETKIAILNRLADGEGSTAVAKEFKLGESTVRAIYKRGSRINESANNATNGSSKRASYSRNVVIEKTEKALVLWIKDLNKKQIPIHGDLIKEKAKQLFNLLKDLEPSNSARRRDKLRFSASNGWLTGFSRRYTLTNVKIRGESVPAGVTGDEKYCQIIAKVIKDGGYCPNQIFNAEKTELFLKKMPSRTFIAKPENTESEKDLDEMTGDETISDSDIINNFINREDEQGEPEETVSADEIYAGIQLCKKLEKHFVKIDTNSERSMKFRRELRACMSGYRDLYMKLTKRSSSQKPITDFKIKKKPIRHKKVRVLDCYEWGLNYVRAL